MTEFMALLFTPPVLAGLFAAVILLFILNIFLFLRLNKVFKGSDAATLEILIQECMSKIKLLSKHDDMLAKHALHLEERLSTAVRNVSTVRFKAFETGASNQSFSIALVDEKGNGVVISSIHNRDRVVTYAKPLKEFVSIYDLTEEEKEVLRRTKKSNNEIPADGEETPE